MKARPNLLWRKNINKELFCGFYENEGLYLCEPKEMGRKK